MTGTATAGTSKENLAVTVEDGDDDDEDVEDDVLVRAVLSSPVRRAGVSGRSAQCSTISASGGQERTKRGSLYALFR